MRYLSKLVFYGLLLVLLGGGGWWLRRFLDRPPVVVMVPVVRDDVTRVLALTGRVRPVVRNDLSFPVSGRLLELRREEGDPVEVGEILARLDDRQVRATIERLAADLAREEEGLEQARRDLRRDRELATGGLVPERALETSRLAVDSAERTVDARREAVAEAEVQLDDFLLRSSLEGVVLERPVDPGQVIAAQQKIYEVATLEEPQVEVEVDERFLAAIAIGQPARIGIPGTVARSLEAQVSYIGQRIDRTSGAALVRLDFVGEVPRLAADLSLDVNIVVAVHPEALTLPRESVAGSAGNPWVLTIEGDRTARRDVQVVDWPSPRVVVLSGVEEGERVVREPRDVGVGIEVRAEAAAGEG